MKKTQDSPDTAAAEVRRLAGERLSEKRESRRPGASGPGMAKGASGPGMAKGASDPSTAKDAARLVHELQVHQIELEMQNEELQQARAQAHTLLAQYTDLYDFAPTGYLTLDREGTIRQVNLTGVRMLGVERSRRVNRRFGQFVAESDRRNFSEFLERLFASEARETCEVALPREGAAPLAVRIEATRSPGGQECHAVVLDITERRQAEELARAATAEIQRMLAASDQSRRALLSAAEDERAAAEALALQARIANVFVTVPDDEMFHEVLEVVLDVMHSPFGGFGYIDEAGALVVPTMTRQIWDKCQVPEKTFVFPRATWGDSSWARALREKQASCSNEASARTPEGHVTLTRHISLPVVFQDEVVGLFQVANKETDYTAADLGTLEAIARHAAPLLNARLQRERAQETLRLLNAELEERVSERTAQLAAANEELEAFSYSVSHDLRAPLRAIDGFSGVVQEDYAALLDDEGRESLARIRAGARRMAQLIDDLLKLARIGRAELHREPLDLSAIAGEVVAELRRQEPARAVEVAVADGLTVQADPCLLRVVLENLLGNAWKFTGKREHARIAFGAEQQDGRTVHFVRDNGAGFDAAYAGRLFGAFSRLHSAEEFAGTGIGLATVQRIVRRHGGRVWAEGVKDQGATFWFDLGTGAECERSNT